MLKTIIAIALIGLAGGIDMRSQQTMEKIAAAQQPRGQFVQTVVLPCDRMRVAQRLECIKATPKRM